MQELNPYCHLQVEAFPIFSAASAETKAPTAYTVEFKKEGTEKPFKMEVPVTPEMRAWVEDAAK